MRDLRATSGSVFQISPTRFSEHPKNKYINEENYFICMLDDNISIFGIF